MMQTSHKKNSKAKILIVDDEKTYIDLLAGILSKEYDIVIARSGEQALKRLQSGRYSDLILLDIMMPGMSGYDFCQHLKESPDTSDIPVIFISTMDKTDQKVAGFKAGGVDFITKPFQADEVLARVHTHLTLCRQRIQLQQNNIELQEKNLKLKQLNDRLRRETTQRQKAEAQFAKADRELHAITAKEAKKWRLESFVGQSKQILQLIDDIRALQSNPRTNVLVLGESGTGKELVARAIHYSSKRSTRPFISINCSAIPTGLADASFFGSVRGAFTGSIESRKGYFDEADGGTLFLDEIGDMPLELQAKLLRTLEQGTITPVGSVKERSVDVRIVAATHVNLSRRINANQFRQDLYYRLSGFQLKLPPLRQRKGDIPLLTRQFLIQYADEMGYAPARLIDPVPAMLEQYDFPGNIRELKNVIENALIRSRGKDIGAEHLVALGLSALPVAEASPAPKECMQAGAATLVESKTLPVGEKPERKTNVLIEVVPGHQKNQTSEQKKKILEYLAANDNINNKDCQELLQTNHNHASYLLKMLHNEGFLIRKGARRWSYYVLADEVISRKK